MSTLLDMRIKVTGYIDLTPEQTDEQHSTGMTAEAYDELFGHESRLSVTDLDDFDVEPVR